MRNVLGFIVFDIRVLEDKVFLKEYVWVYFLICLYGKMWIYGVIGKGVEGWIVINRFFSCVFLRVILLRVVVRLLMVRFDFIWRLFWYCCYRKFFCIGMIFKVFLISWNSWKSFCFGLFIMILMIWVFWLMRIVMLLVWLIGSCFFYGYLELVLVVFIFLWVKILVGSFGCLMNLRLWNGFFGMSCLMGC